MPLTPPAAVLWDMDGTLVDTEPLWMTAEVELMADRGLPWTQADHHRLVGMPLLAVGEELYAAGARPEPVTIVARLVAAVSAALAVEVPWLPGVRELLADLRGAGVPCAMVTMSYRELAEAVAADAPGAFAAIVAGDEVTDGKPHPEAYLRAAAALGVPIEACVAIEDSVPGVASAYASGARTIAIQSAVPIPPRPGLSRVDAVSRLDLADIARVAAGETIDLVDAPIA